MWFMAAAAFAGAGAFEGTWAFSGGEAQRAEVEAVKEATAMRFNFAIRPIVRGKIKKVFAIDDTITVSGEGEKVQLDFTGANARSATGPSDGTPIEKNGAKISYTVGPKTLIVNGSSDDGGKISTYTLLSPEKLRLTVVVSSPAMGDPPVTWSVDYRRR